MWGPIRVGKIPAAPQGLCSYILGIKTAHEINVLAKVGFDKTRYAPRPQRTQGIRGPRAKEKRGRSQFIEYSPCALAVINHVPPHGDYFSDALWSTLSMLA